MLRVGRKVGRTIYQQTGPEPSDADELIGLMDTPELAQLVVRSVNSADLHVCLHDDGHEHVINGDVCPTPQAGNR